MVFSSPAGRDTLLIESLDGSEGISRLFEYHAELFAVAGTTIDVKSLIAARVCVSIALSEVAGSRYINGIIASFEQTGGDIEFDTYRARIVPGMWQLTLNSTCRVFQGKTVVDVVKEVLGEYALSVTDDTTFSYKALEYCTQYAESDFHFVTRLLEESGIFYWFEHTDQDNTIHLADDRTAYTDCPVSSAVEFELSMAGQEGTYGSKVTELNSTATMVTGKHSTKDYDHRTYAAHPVEASASASDFGINAYESYVYPAGEEGYVKLTDSQLTKPDFATLFRDSRLKASDAVAEVFHGTSTARSLCAGYTFTLSKHLKDDWNKKYLLTSVSCQVSQVPSYRSSAESVANPYENRFAAISADIVFKPLRTAAKPRIPGPQTAVVVSPSGEEMFIDKLGRVCVQFFWDKVRDTSYSTMDNTWVRVAQSWAGNGWGTYFWPRLKDEVIVQFLDGDPDCPIVTGSVYNGVNVPKYALPDASTRSGILTRSSKGGGADNANELRFEDKAGNEQIFINAEKDMDLRVENDHRRVIGAKDSLIVKGDQAELVKGKHDREIKGDSVAKIGGKSDINVGMDLSEKVGQDFSLKIGMNHAEKVGMNYTLDAGMDVYLKGGMNVILEAGMNLCLKGSGGFIAITPAGIAISGTMVLINSGGAAIPGQPGQLKDPGDPAAPDEADDGTKGGKM